MDFYIDSRINKVFISGKGFGLIATDEIPDDTIIIEEKPAFTIPNSEIIYSELFQLLYIILSCSDTTLIKKFNKLHPKTLKDFNINTLDIKKEFLKIKEFNLHIFNFFFENYTFNEILLYCSKYMCNAFEFQKRPAIFFVATLLNHSCLPNVIFGEKNNKMVFVTARKIKKGEELFDNYIDITLEINSRKELLKNQYGFICNCTRCQEKNNNKIEFLNKQALVIEIKREKLFKNSKSKFIN